MAWTIRFDDTCVNIEDLPIAEFVPIARKHDVSWYELLATPGAHPQALYEVICVAARAAGVPAPDPVEKMGDVVRLIGMLEVGTDTLPTRWDDGNPQVAEQETN